MLKRPLLAVLAMSLAGACVIALVMMSNGTPADLPSEMIYLPVVFLALSLSAYLHFYIPLLFSSALLAVLLLLIGCKSPRSAFANGAVYGLVITAFLIFIEFRGHLLALAIGAPYGAICGWIYWWFAVRGRPSPAPTGWAE